MAINGDLHVREQFSSHCLVFLPKTEVLEDARLQPRRLWMSTGRRRLQADVMPPLRLAPPSLETPERLDGT